MDWTQQEVQLIVRDYFGMLELELEHRQFNKSEHRRQLLKSIKRSNSSIEQKHRNISSVLNKMGYPSIDGYKPLSNAQKLLKLEVCQFLEENKQKFAKLFLYFTNEVVADDPTQILNFEEMLDNDPPQSVLKEDEPQYRPIKINFLEREQKNKLLGDKGEELVITYEKWRLVNAGKTDLANKVEWTSRDLGDGTGYDILSKNVNGADRFIEVKTTKLSKETPIFITKTEVQFATLKEKDFFLYRVFNFASKPQIFIKQGSYEKFCKLMPETFKGYFRTQI